MSPLWRCLDRWGHSPPIDIDLDSIPFMYSRLYILTRLFPTKSLRAERRQGFFLPPPFFPTTFSLGSRLSLRLFLNFFRVTLFFYEGPPLISLLLPLPCRPPPWDLTLDVEAGFPTVSAGTGQERPPPFASKVPTPKSLALRPASGRWLSKWVSLIPFYPLRGLDSMWSRTVYPFISSTPMPFPESQQFYLIYQSVGTPRWASLFLVWPFPVFPPELPRLRRLSFLSSVFL